MKLQRTTLILLLLALGLGGFVFMKFKVLLSGNQPRLRNSKFFSFEEDQVQSFTVKTKEQTLEFGGNNQMVDEGS